MIMGKIVFEGKNLDEALENACKELGIEKDKIKYEILEKGSKGFLKVFSKKTKIEVLIEKRLNLKEKIEEILDKEISEINFEKTNKPSEKSYNNDEEVIETAKEFIQELFKFFDIELRVDYRQHKDKVLILIFTQGDFIKTNNFEEFIYSIQYLTNKMISSKYRSNLKFEIDINEYIKKKIVKLKQFAKEISIKAKNEHRSIKLRPMYPNERRIIHVTLKNDKHIRTESVGNGEKKRIIISPTEQ
jgi:spoIIIJ-associated protein